MKQYEAELYGDTRKFRRLFDDMKAIEDTLKARPGDQRRALLPLLVHPNYEVRIHAAKASLAVEPELAREALRQLSLTNHDPQGPEAAMTLRALDRGEWKPT